MSQTIPRPRLRNGEVNKVLPEDTAVHSWYRFVLSFPPHLVRHYALRFGVGPGDTVLDPFCGTGTTLVECRKLRIPCIGMEAHPMAHFASQVKVDWTPDPAGLLEHARRAADAALAELDAQGIGDVSLFPTSDPQPLRTLPSDGERLLLKGSLSPVPLHRALVLLDAIDRLRDERYRNHERLALANALVTSIGNLRFGPEVGVGPARSDAPVVSPWLSEVHRMTEDLTLVRGLPPSDAIAHCADSREAVRALRPESISAVITSPPYPNEKDYTRITRLESVILGFVRNKADLQSLKRRLVRSNTRGVYKGDDDDIWVKGHPDVQRIAGAIEARRLELGKSSGFERLYARVTRLYFGGMARHFAELRRYLRPGAHLAYVVGDQASYLRVMIRTGHLLADIASSLGYEVVDLDLFRTRLATATKEQLREEVLVLRWPGSSQIIHELEPSQ